MSLFLFRNKKISFFFPIQAAQTELKSELEIEHLVLKSACHRYMRVQLPNPNYNLTKLVRTNYPLTKQFNPTNRRGAITSAVFEWCRSARFVLETAAQKQPFDLHFGDPQRPQGFKVI